MKGGGMDVDGETWIQAWLAGQFRQMPGSAAGG